MLLKREIGKGACLGTHVPYALLNLLRLNLIGSFLTEATAAQVRRHLKLTSAILERTQRGDGSWPVRWAEGIDVPIKSGTTEEVIAILTIVGHHLEWIAYAPADLRPRDDCLQRAVRFATGSLSKLPPALIEEQYHVLTHIGRACCAFAGVDHGTAYRLLL